MGLCTAIGNRHPYVDNRISNYSMISAHEGGPIHPLAKSCVTFLMLHASNDPKACLMQARHPIPMIALCKGITSAARVAIYNRCRTEGLQQKV